MIEKVDRRLIDERINAHFDAKKGKTVMYLFWIPFFVIGAFIGIVVLRAIVGAILFFFVR